MSISQLLGFFLLNAVGILSPGPDIFLITRQATKSRTHALATVAGVATGAGCWGALAVFGAAVVFHTNPGVLIAIQILGGLWLMFLGQAMLRASWKQFHTRRFADDQGELILGTKSKAYVLGLSTNLSNPKIVLYFSAILVPLMPASPDVGTALLLLAIIVGANVLVFGTLAVSISTPLLRKKFLQLGPWIDLFAGLFFVVAGLSMVIAGIRGL